MSAVKGDKKGFGKLKRLKVERECQLFLRLWWYFEGTFTDDSNGLLYLAKTPKYHESSSAILGYLKRLPEQEW